MNATTSTNNDIVDNRSIELILLSLGLCLGYLAYQKSTVDHLFWLLKPTVQLVTWVSGASFTFVAEQGFVRSDGQVLIHKGCSGGHFLLTSIGLGWFVLLPSLRIGRWKAISITLVILSPFLLTLFANTSRICTAMWALKLNVHRWLSLSKQGLHFGIGLFTYLVMFISYYFILQGWNHVVRNSQQHSS